MAPGSLQRSEASRPWSIAVVAPDPTEPKPCSRLLICLQINQQTIAGKIAARKAALTGGLRRRTLICCCNVQISASSITRDRIRSPTIQPMSLQRSLIAHDHRPILDRLPSGIRFATGTSRQTVVRVRVGSPLDPEHCEHANPHYLGAQCGDFKLRRNAKRRLQGATLDFVAIGQLHR